MSVINIAAQYTKNPGGRFRTEGDFSGEDFRETMLKKEYEISKRNNEELTVVLDGGYGYGSSFLEEAFGGLVRVVDNVDITIIKVVSREEPQLIEDVKKYLEDAVLKKGGTN